MLNGAAKMLGYKSFMSPSYSELGFPDGSANRIPDPKYGNYEKYIKAYADEIWVYACVSRRAQDVATSPIYLFDKKTKKKIESHPVLELLANPNPSMNRDMLLEWIETSLLLVGSGYLLLDEQDGAGRPKALWPLMPQLVEVIPSKDPKIFIERFDYHNGEKAVPYLPSQVKQVRLPNLLSYHYGLPPLAAARMSADTHRASSKWNLRFFDNSSRPDMVFETPHSLTPEQRKRMAVSWAAMHQGEDKSHGVAFLEKGTVAKLVGAAPKDMEFLEQKKMSREEMCAVYRVPPSLVGLFEYANYATAKEQEQMYWRSPIVPDSKRIADFLTSSILHPFDPAGRLAFMVDESEIKALQEDEVARSGYVFRYWSMGVPLNALVSAYHLPFGNQPGGDEPHIQTTPQIGQPGAPQEAQAGPGKALPSAKTLRAMKRTVFDSMTAAITPSFRKSVRDFLDKQRDSIISAVREAHDPSATRAAIKRNTENDKALASAIAPHIQSAISRAHGAELDLIGNLVKGISRVKSPARIDRWVDLNALKWAKEINDTTFKDLDGVLDNALAEGLGIDETSRALAEKMDGARDYRTDRVAQTEIIAALNEGALEAYRENEQVAGKAWLATQDEYTRLSHTKAGEDYNELNPIPVDEDFEVGEGSGLSPGQISDVGENCNCRCTIFPVVKEL